MPKTKVVLDTNVLISGILFSGKPRQTLELVIQGRINAYISPADWSTEEIILGSRAQSHVEDAFKQMKDPHWVSFSPAFHWTDQKLRVHAFYCVLALTLSSLLQRKAAQAGIKLTIPALFEELTGIKEVINLYQSQPTQTRGRLRADYVLSERSPLQEKLCKVFDIYKLAHP